MRRLLSRYLLGREGGQAPRSGHAPHTGNIPEEPVVNRAGLGLPQQRSHGLPKEDAAARD